MLPNDFTGVIGATLSKFFRLSFAVANFGSGRNRQGWFWSPIFKFKLPRSPYI